MKLLTIGVDLDGTLCEDVPFTEQAFRNAPPRESSIRLVNALAEEGHRIIVWTGRPESMRSITDEWLRNNGVLFAELVMDKLRVDLYIDEMKKLLGVPSFQV